MSEVLKKDIVEDFTEGKIKGIEYKNERYVKVSDVSEDLEMLANQICVINNPYDIKNLYEIYHMIATLRDKYEILPF